MKMYYVGVVIDFSFIQISIKCLWINVTRDGDYWI